MTTANNDPDARIYTAALAIIGNEILSGRTQDANLAHLAKTLNTWGVEMREVRVVPDIEGEIVDAVNALRARYDYVFTTGGIGPTHDDITADSIAKAFALPLIEHPAAIALLAAHYPPGELTPVRRRMARVPDGADLIENPISKAPGFRIGNVFVLAGVPAIMRAQLEGARGFIAGGRSVQSRTVSVLVGESRIAELLEDVQKHYPDTDIGSYPFFRKAGFGTALVLRGRDLPRLEEATESLRQALRGAGIEAHEGEIPA
ncbi:competence/damage-inducible protein A [Zavarzinia compransoris]|uniref:Competence/damage-inducible protein A n=1 Tax=Zavarzinia compransoris TaxID=1264899 RepID=A0A317ECR2_9PROT|nr:molybdopterin-binding protein [Zavarzinia compransoris]PWR23920.1 competence/damage-inducible protein A [Zavarzinia compransoris]TDP48165.1 molybdenum cofactor synthesis domain-containing protein [Zavarzinia compransoris]